MDKAHPLTSPMVVRSFDVKKIIFVLQKRVKNFLVPKYLSEIGVLTYLANCTQSDIVFSVKLLARYDSAPIRRH